MNGKPRLFRDKRMPTIAHWRPKQAIACKPPRWPNLAFVANSLHVLFLLSGASFLLVSKPSTEYTCALTSPAHALQCNCALWLFCQSRGMVSNQNGVMQWPQLEGGVSGTAPRDAVPRMPRANAQWLSTRNSSILASLINVALAASAAV